MDTLKIITYWTAGAESDFKAFHHLYENKDYPQSLFWGHLVIEKYLKAIVVRKIGNQAPYTHDLVLLAKTAQLPLSQEQRDHLNEINTFNQFGRYDNEIVSFLEKCTPEYAERYFTIINQLATWLKEYLANKS